MKLTAEIFVEGKNNLFEAFRPEEKQMKRSDYVVEKTKKGVKFSVNANDAVAFRATISTITQLLATHEKMVDINGS